MKRPWKILSSFLLVILLGFGIGYWIGRHQDPFFKVLRITQKPVVFFIEDRSFFPPVAQNTVLQRLDFDVKFIFPQGTEDPKDLASQADIVLARQKNLIRWNLLPSLDLKNQSLIRKLRSQIAPDFLIKDTETYFTFPYLWKVYEKDSRLEVISFFVPESPTLQKEKIIRLTREFFQPELVRLWLKDSDYSTTLMVMDESSLPPEKKSLSIRRWSLQKLNM